MEIDTKVITLVKSGSSLLAERGLGADYRDEGLISDSYSGRALIAISYQKRTIIKS